MYLLLPPQEACTPPAQPVGCVLLLNAPKPYLLATDPEEKLLFSHWVPRHVPTPASAGGVHNKYHPN